MKARLRKLGVWLYYRSKRRRCATCQHWSGYGFNGDTAPCFELPRVLRVKSEGPVKLMTPWWFRCKSHKIRRTLTAWVFLDE